MLRHVHRRLLRVGAALLARAQTLAPPRSGGFPFFRKSNTERKNYLKPQKDAAGVALEVALALFHEAATRYDAFCVMFSQTTRFLFHLASVRPMYLDLKVLNKTLDDTMMRAGLDVSVDVEPEIEEAGMTWKQLLDGDREQEEAHLSRATDANELPFDCDNLSNDILEDLVLFKFELEFFKAGNSIRLLVNMNKVFSIVSCKIKNAEVHVPDWYIPESELNYTRVVLEGMRGTVGTAHRGEWMNRKSVKNDGTANEMPMIRTVVVKCLHLDSDPNGILEKEVATWFSMDHPRILKLYGVSRCSRRALLVCEDASNGSLQNYMTRQALREERPELQSGKGKQRQKRRSSLSQNERFELWSMFVEAAEGLMFLHNEKKMVHGNLKRNNILVTSDVTKLQNIYRSGQYSMGHLTQCNFIDALGWRACECRSFRTRLSFQADIYSLGLCVLDVLLPESDDHDFVSTSRPGYADFDPLSVSVKRRLHRSEWELISGMCQVKSEDRLTLRQGVCNWEEEELAVLPTKENTSEQERRQVSPNRSTRATGNVLGIQEQHSPSAVIVRVFGDFMRNDLLNLNSLCDGMAESKGMCLCVLHRLQDIHHELSQMTSHSEEEHEKKYRALVLRYERFLKKYAHKKAISRLICMRKIVSQNKAFHDELDTAVSKVALSHLSQSTWRDDWEADRKKQEEIWTEACKPKGLLDMELKDDDARVEALVLLKYESSSYLSNLDDTVSKVVRKLCQRVEFERGLLADVCSVLRWFLPPYELECNDEPFATGGYGAAYHGTWQGTDVVVKRLLRPTGGEQARGEFMKEVTIWNKELGALRWKAPEILQAASGSSFEADIFSLAMTIVEAITRGFPWCGLEDNVVRFHLGKGTRLPRPHEVFTDEQWAFVELMSAPVPSDRPAMSTVVEKLRKWAIDEEESNSCIDSNTDSRVWRGLEELCALAPSNRPPLSDVIKMLKNAMAANNLDESTFQGAASPA
ncbi:hypothetical protein BBJ28_00000006 [Nothophytophthora sp. Chile5]|nr:hypothetical protein BBJ28_00000006 [Nothophytophthora sp. Chile5]